MIGQHQFRDAQAALGFVISQTSYIESAVNEIIYPDIQYPDLIPIDTSAHPFAKTVTYYSADKFGAAKWINGNAGDIPIAGTELTKFETPVYMAGIGYSYGYEEWNQAMMLGYPLQDADARAARRAYEEFTDTVLLIGSAEKNFFGMIDHPSVTPQAAPNGDWSGTGADVNSIIEDFNFGLRAAWSGTNYTSLADTVLLPFLKLDMLASYIIPGTTATLLSFIRANNTYTATTGRPLTIRGVRGLDTAGVGNTARMISYRRSPEVLKAHIPMPHRFLPPVPDGPLKINVAGVFRIGGLDVRLPAEVRYTDGI